jgi:small subunit ribosomal protein S25e
MIGSSVLTPFFATFHAFLEPLQPPKVQQKSKEQKMAAAMAGGKGKKKKWSKGKSRDKVDNKVLFSKEQFDRLHSEVPKMKLITVSAVVEKLKVSGGLARRALRDLAEEGKIRPVLLSRSQQIYTRNIGEGEEE